MAKKKAKNKAHVEPHQATVKPQAPQPQTALPEQENELLELSDPDTFRKAFIASEILNRKY
ncbi:MAG: hypothetical protein IJT12_01095 [Paludibacteraceae bacterium]|nr:hypothetical protein [Paludibacteraceae bacterium]